MAKETIKTMHERDISAERTRSRAVGIIAKAFCYAFLIFMALVVLFPFYWMINSSLKSLEEYRQSVPTFWPQKVLWSNYAEAFRKPGPAVFQYGLCGHSIHNTFACYNNSVRVRVCKA